MSAPARINGQVVPYLDAAIETVLAELRGHGIGEREIRARILAGEALYLIAKRGGCLISQILLLGRETEARVTEKILEGKPHVA